MAQGKPRIIFSDIDGTLAHPVEGPMTVEDTNNGTLTCSLTTEVRYITMLRNQSKLNVHIFEFRFCGAGACELGCKSSLNTCGCMEQDRKCGGRMQNLQSELLALPVSSTGQRGYISTRSLELLSAARDAGIKVVLISGARTSTVLERLPCLPLADAVVTENGGRVWYTDGSWKTCLPMREDTSWRKVLSPVTGTALSHVSGLYVSTYI